MTADAPLMSRPKLAELLADGCGPVVNGCPVRAAATMEHRYPGTGEVQAEFGLADGRTVDDAVAAARDSGAGWAALAPVKRAGILRALAAAMRRRTLEFTQISQLECGMPARLAASQAPIAADFFEYYAGWCDKIRGDQVVMGDALDIAMAEPFGTIAVLYTWNSPAAAIGMKLAPVLAAGCTAVLKPPELAPFSAALFAETCREAELPDGVVNVLPGGPDVGAALVGHPGIDKVTFTGGVETGARIQALAAANVTPVLLELGGKSASVVFADADLELAARSVAWGVLGMSGQTCVAPTRLLVERPVHEQVLARVVEIMRGVEIGDPFSPTARMGPVISATARDRIQDCVAKAESAGSGRKVLDEPLPAALADSGGYYVSPVVFDGVDPGDDLAQREVFGPVLAVTPFDDETEAVAVANGTRYGLAAYLHTTSLARAHRVARRLDAGNVAVNGGSPMAAPYAPFGGVKQSGYGAEGGLQGLHEFLRLKNVNIRLTG